MGVGGGGELNDGKAEGANREWPRKVRDPTLTLVVGPRKRLITWILALRNSFKPHDHWKHASGFA